MFSTSLGTVERGRERRGSQAEGQTQAKGQRLERVAWLEWRVCVKEWSERKLGVVCSLEPTSRKLRDTLAA